MDINLTTARPPVDSLYQAYVSSPSLSTLTPLMSTLHIHEHVYQLSDHLRSKLAWTSPTALLFFSPSHPSPAPSAPAQSLSPSPLPTGERPTISFAAVNVTSLEDELLSERIVKTFHVHLPPSQCPPSPRSLPTTSPSPLVVMSDWRTERNKMRGMGICSYSMRVLVHVPLALTADFPPSVASAALTLLSSDYASFLLVDGYDTDEGREGDGAEVAAAGGLLELLPVLMQMGKLSREEFVWLFSVLCTFPSDFAFDVLSDRLMKLKAIPT